MNICNGNFQPPPEAIVLYANYACFGPGKTVHADCVQSRMLLWCKSGRGRVTVNGRLYEFTSGAFLFIPWNHEIHYQADNDAPFTVAGIHLVTKLPPRGKIEYQIFHTAQPDSAEYRRRRDALIPGFAETFAGRFKESDALALLAEYIVTWFQWQPRAEFMARNLAQALIYELWQVKNNLVTNPESYPLPLRRMLDYIDRHIEEKIGLSMLAAQAGCSPPTVFRLFKTHLKISPCNWILKQKVQHAMGLLRTTRLAVKAIGERVGIEDPYYFSKVFKKFSKTTAGAYRNSHSLVK